jgi:S-(hydroxymethyl)glutathione dehydrogenase/alcohol dehydrogenase
MVSALPVVERLTNGRGADRVLLTMGVLRKEFLEQALALTAAGGACVIAAMAPSDQMEASVNLRSLVMNSKEIIGSVYGGLNPRQAVPTLLNLYQKGQLNLDDMISPYPLESINRAFEDMRRGAVVRAVLTFDL